MSAKRQYKDGVDDEILAVLSTITPLKTTIVTRMCGNQCPKTVINHLHRLAKEKKVIRETVIAPGRRFGTCFTWRKTEC